MAISAIEPATEAITMIVVRASLALELTAETAWTFVAFPDVDDD
jgi:hypothetical protein